MPQGAFRNREAAFDPRDQYGRRLSARVTKYPAIAFPQSAACLQLQYLFYTCREIDLALFLDDLQGLLACQLALTHEVTRHDTNRPRSARMAMHQDSLATRYHVIDKIDCVIKEPGIVARPIDQGNRNHIVFGTVFTAAVLLQAQNGIDAILWLLRVKVITNCDLVGNPVQMPCPLLAFQHATQPSFLALATASAKLA